MQDSLTRAAQDAKNAIDIARGLVDEAKDLGSKDAEKLHQLIKDLEKRVGDFEQSPRADTPEDLSKKVNDLGLRMELLELENSEEWGPETEKRQQEIKGKLNGQETNRD